MVSGTEFVIYGILCDRLVESLPGTGCQHAFGRSTAAVRRVSQHHHLFSTTSEANADTDTAANASSKTTAPNTDPYAGRGCIVAGPVAVCRVAIIGRLNRNTARHASNQSQ